MAKPLLMQLVHTYAVCVFPLSTTFCFCKFGLKDLLVLRLEWLKEPPETGALPHTAHLYAIISFLITEINLVLIF